MKKIIFLISIICLALSFTACSENGGDTVATTASSTDGTPVITEAPTSTVEPTPTPELTSTPEPINTSELSNVALNKPVMEQGNAYESSYWNKDFLTDGIKMVDDIEGSTNGWMSDASENIDDETWVYVDLEESYTVQAVAVYPRESEMFFPVVYEIQVSMDAENWTTVKNVQDDYGQLDVNRVFAVEPAKARYVRILVKERYDELPGYNINGYIAEISEVEVYA